MASLCVSKVVNRMKPVVVILGATGTGKSKLAIEMAHTFNGEIISADSMQVYKGLDIVTNKVSQQERAQCPHHMIDFVCPLQASFTVTDFRSLALNHIEEIWSRQKLPIVVGGTNYYIESLLWDFLLDTSSRGSVSATTQLSATSVVHSEQQSSLSLYQRLQAVDPISAQRIHPNDKRKIRRALEVFEKTGETRSKHLELQHSSSVASLSAVSGPLRLKESCLLWLQCEPDVLDLRLDARVDEMISAGLFTEMLDFHQVYNQQQLSDNKHCDYTLGIFQSIGFKEFHNFLILSDEDKCTELGKHLFTKGVDSMKRATRKYARQQLKWIVNRFTKRKGSDMPPIYALDASDVSNWQTHVYQQATDIVSAFLQCCPPPVTALHCEVGQDDHMYKECEECGVYSVSRTNWLAHIKGRRHKKTIESLRRTSRLHASLLTEDCSPTKSEII